MARQPKPITASYLENAALHYLQRFATSSENLRRVLMRRVERAARAGVADREAAAALVDALVARYAGAGLLDDAAYAEARARSLHRRGRSLRAIRSGLAAKGVDEETALASLEGLRAETPDAELAGAVNLARRRRLGPCRPPEERADNRRRDLGILARAGFPPEVARRVVDAPSLEALLAETEG